MAMLPFLFVYIALNMNCQVRSFPRNKREIHRFRGQVHAKAISFVPFAVKICGSCPACRCPSPFVSCVGIESRHRLPRAAGFFVLSSIVCRCSSYIVYCAMENCLGLAGRTAGAAGSVAPTRPYPAFHGVHYSGIPCRLLDHPTFQKNRTALSSKSAFWRKISFSYLYFFNLSFFTCISQFFFVTL